MINSTWLMNDVGEWFEFNNGICPNCKTDMKGFDPHADIWHHYVGACCDEYDDSGIETE